MPGEYVERALGKHHTGIYGLGEWRELLDEQTGEAYQISSPGWAGAYPWINKREGVCGFLSPMCREAPARKMASRHFTAVRSCRVRYQKL